VCDRSLLLNAYAKHGFFPLVGLTHSTPPRRGLNISRALILWIPWTTRLRKSTTEKFLLAVVSVVAGKVESAPEIKQGADAGIAPVLENQTGPEE
jgi:hypothetical protein